MSDEPFDLEQYQAEFRKRYALVSEGRCAVCTGPLDVHEHDGEAWACCSPCETAWRAGIWRERNGEERDGWTDGEPMLTSTGTYFWHRLAS